jgi:peptidoglycan biosynthesis protein MviN/MurJ (putative lipid II flippase)
MHSVHPVLVRTPVCVLGSRLLCSLGPVAIQTSFGYLSAALGLACELVIAARFGASATTDVYRWAGLLPFYANSTC